MISDIVEFLRARLDEDERDAKQQPSEWAEDWAKFLVDPIIGPFGGQSRLRNVATGLYVAAQSDPRRVLAEVAAKRAMINSFAAAVENLEDSDPCKDYARGWLVFMTAVYVDHPDFQREWLP